MSFHANVGLDPKIDLFGQLLQVWAQGQELQKLAKKVDFGVESHVCVKRHVLGQNFVKRTLRPSKKCFEHIFGLFWGQKSKKSILADFRILAKWPF